ncbi:hypothetical protein OIU84_023748 [Salix udensis]|uniref:Secreted protein n=1 Tax=Salix udensis TaxID=889485 RepID=A0AAD6PGN2_9ROSI|nr:hypothetical protein OIU84_023748 [Salix udensis]
MSGARLFSSLGTWLNHGLLLTSVLAHTSRWHVRQNGNRNMLRCENDMVQAQQGSTKLTARQQALVSGHPSPLVFSPLPWAPPPWLL